MDFEKINTWFDKLLQTDFVIIAGPCAAENRQQVLDTAREISQIENVKIFRSGLWKPRTTPNSFQGVGETGLEWLKEVKEHYNLLITTEVANAKHVETVLETGVIDIIWIGARTVSNPFSVQEIADSLKGTDIAVMVKNPIHPDLRLWIGAIERLYKAGIRKIAAIHRGFYPFEKSKLRNIPKWEIPIELKTQLPSLSIIGDPSHIAGDTKYIFEIAQYAINIGFDGLMIETHINPSQALSDAKQQLTPLQLKDLLNKLAFRKKNNHFETPSLEHYRNQIDSIDFQLIELLAQRMKIVEKIGKLKSEKSLSIFDLRRWQNIKETRIKFGKKLGLNEEFLKKLLQLIHKESINKQQNIKNGTKK